MKLNYTLLALLAFSNVAAFADTAPQEIVFTALNKTSKKAEWIAKLKYFSVDSDEKCKIIFVQKPKKVLAKKKIGNEISIHSDECQFIRNVSVGLEKELADSKNSNGPNKDYYASTAKREVKTPYTYLVKYGSGEAPVVLKSPQECSKKMNGDLACDKITILPSEHVLFLVQRHFQ